MKKSKTNQVANFEKLVSFGNAQGAVYNPSKASIKVAALQTLLTQAQGSLQAADVSRTAYENAINARQPVFNSIPKMASRMIGALIASGASAEAIADAKSISRRFYSPAKDRQPISSGQAGAAPVSEEKRGGISQLDLASKVENFVRLYNRVSVEPFYKPNEVDLQLPALNAFITFLREKNKAVLSTFMAMKNANRTLDNVLFESSGLHEHAVAVKAYIRSVFGSRSPKHREVTVIQFRNA